MFSYGEFKAEDQEKMLAALNKRVESVYRVCIGDNEANIRSENRSFHQLSSTLPPLLYSFKASLLFSLQY